MKIDELDIPSEMTCAVPLGSRAETGIKNKKISSAQIRAARGLLNLSARRLSELSGVSPSTVHRAEASQGCPNLHDGTLAAVKATLETLGVEFLGHSGVCLRSPAG